MEVKKTVGSGIRQPDPSLASATVLPPASSLLLTLSFLIYKTGII